MPPRISEFKSIMIRRLLAVRYFTFDRGGSALPPFLSPGQEVRVTAGTRLDFDSLNSRYDLDIMDVVHVGANIGQELESYVASITGSITLIEPLREPFLELTQLADSIDCNRVQLHNLAIGNSSGSAEIHVAGNGGQSSSLLAPRLHLHQAPQVTFDTTEIVNIKRLDEIFTHKTMPNLLVLDVQGYELQVLESAGGLLAEVDYIFTEVNRAENYQACTQIEDLDNFLELFGLRRSLTQWQGTWGDALYHRENISSKDSIKNHG